MTQILFFQRLVNACSFEDLALRLTLKTRIDEARVLFPYAKPRIIMSSVMIYKFPEHHAISETSDIYICAKNVCNKGLAGQITEYDYVTFRDLFFIWIKKDKDVMMIELNKAQEELSKTIEEEGVEWADRDTWKECINAQVKLIEDSKLVLEKSHETIFGTPPK